MVLDVEYITLSQEAAVAPGLALLLGVFLPKECPSPDRIC